MAKPDEELASRVVERIRKAGLLSESALSEVREGLSAGTLSTDGWKLLVGIELSGKKEAHPLED